MISNNKVGFKDFFVSRFARLYPLHLLTLIVVSVGQSLYYRMTGFHYLNDVRYTAPYFLSHLFMASNRVSNGDSFNWPVWSVCLEVSVYLLFFIVTRYTTRSILFNFLIVALFLFVRWAMPSAPFMVLFECLFFFYVGGISAILKGCPSRTGILSALMWTGVVLIPIMFWLNGRILSSDKMYLFWSLWLPVLLFCAAHDFKAAGWLRKVIETLGNMTYSSYLIHIPVQLFIAIVCFHWRILLPLHQPVFLVSYFLFVFFLSSLMYRYFESPIKGKIKASKIFARQQSAFIFIGSACHLILAFSPIVELWDKAARAHDDFFNQKTYAASGKIFMNAGKYYQAIAAYNHSIQRYPYKPEDYVNLADIYFKLDRYADALVNLDRAIAIHPNYYVAYNTRGVIYVSQKDYELALENFKMAVSLDPCEGLNHNWGMDFDNVEKVMCSNASRIHFNIGSIYMIRKDYTRALVHYTRAIAMDPGYAKAYADRALCYFQLKDNVRFHHDAQKAQSLGGKVDPLLLRRANDAR